MDDCDILKGNKTPAPSPTPYSTSTPVYCSGQTGINTAIGCIHVLGTPEQFLGDILRWAVGIGGGIAFLLIIYAGFMIMTSSGNPERLKAGQELLTSAISGLILLVFSIFILKFIGVDILGLCKFGFGP
ncbi:MAG: pilin, partial [Candidatus Woesebacteria bacterium]|nr:pilin [Candidatus Woesebacteria bacterium]